ncbi:hypothetical protein [Dyella tabacisoli]|uniref:Secreted protein n=1 Tax=Dyella tabacisoli TaxID=2282381 RepID=A0A369ULY5_9GAMM|nr:hypothetical protein [Dyella tabacisoli]RDD81095.1 hypothetical protein DVJ77_12220 [Dyella tabacisoli]
MSKLTNQCALCFAVAVSLMGISSVSSAAEGKPSPVDNTAAVNPGEPIVNQVDAKDRTSVPRGSKVACMTGPNSPRPDGESTTCPVVAYDNIQFWPLSYVDNRFDMNLVGYNADGRIVSQRPLDGARYIWKVTVDSTARTVTFWGQSNHTVVLPWGRLE